MSTNTAEEILANYRKKNAERQSKHYLAKKDEINAKRRAVYKSGVLARRGESEMIVDEPRPPAVVVPAVMATSQFGNNVVDFSKAKTLTLTQVSEALDSIVKTPASLKKYKNDFKMFVRITDCNDNILACLKKPQTIIPLIKNAKQRNGEPYSINSLKGVFQVIPYVITHLNLSLPKKTVDAYLKEFELSKMSSEGYRQQVADTRETISFQDYLQKVREKFGEDSKMFVIANMYNEFTLRDNFGLLVVNKLPANLDDKNYLVIKPKSMEISINQYKTLKKYKAFTEPVSKGLDKIVRKYVKDNNVQFGSYLFGSEKLTGFVSLSNRQMGLTGSVGEFRHMKITDILSDPNITNEEKLELSNKMKHSPMIQLKYLRKFIV